MTTTTADYIADMTNLAAERARVLADHNAFADPMPACPTWCVQPPGHPWDGLNDEAGTPLRDHAGPYLGAWASVGAEEDHAGGSSYDVMVEIPAETTADVAQLRRMAANISAAADWLEAQA